MLSKSSTVATFQPLASGACEAAPSARAHGRVTATAVESIAADKATAAIFFTVFVILSPSLCS